MTNTRSEMCFTTERSCAMNTRLKPSSFCSSLRRLTT
ncbi:Uncharacterised protein [Vibrio cholerae]|nr:Uncharacterised protein [Vibrio cholerae]